jgi:two-component system cell cycle sensor histidine kinase/response regulator CckA
MAFRVLVVEKEPVVRELLVELLREGDREVIQAATVSEALHSATVHAPVDVVLAEKELRDRSGLELTRELKALDFTTEVILMSTSTSVHSVLESVEAGATDYLPKPFEDVTQVAMRVASAEERAGLRRERQRLHRALVESEERYRKLFEATPDAVVVFDERTGLIAAGNRAALLLYGYDEAEFVGLPIAKLRHAERGSAQLSGADGAVTPVGRIVRRRDRARGGTVLDVELASGRFQAHGRDMVVEIVRDIGDRLRAESAKAELEEQLRQSQKMEALGRLAGGIAHDFNNLLTVILNYASFASKMLWKKPDAQGLARVRDDLEQILQAASSATAVTRQLLAFSRREVVAPEVLNVNDVVGAIEKLLRRTLGERIELEVRQASDLRPVEMDRGQLEQVIINLAVNARDAMPEGGRLLLETRDLDALAPALKTGGRDADRGWVVVDVTDTGAGMPPQVAEKVFEPFFTTKQREQGTGLGLATVKGIVDRAGGHIELSTEPGRGSSFSIYLPPTHLPMHTVPAAAVAPSGVPRGESVLVVDDDDAVRRAICRILADSGYVVHEARNGKDAVLEHQRCGGRVDLLLTDVVMPVMSGDELAQQLRTRQPDLRVIYTTGYATTTVIERTSEREARVVLPKPFREERLLGLVREVLEAGSGG